MGNPTVPRVELGRKTESGIHAVEPPDKLFGRLVAMELINISLCEAILNNKDLDHVRSELLNKWQNGKEIVTLQASNYSDTRVAAIAKSNNQSTSKAFRDSLSEFLNYLDDIEQSTHPRPTKNHNKVCHQYEPS